jgi:hypothetical protein
VCANEPAPIGWPHRTTGGRERVRGRGPSVTGVGPTCQATRARARELAGLDRAELG